MNKNEKLDDIFDTDYDSLNLIISFKEEFVKKLFKNCTLLGILGISLVISLLIRNFWLDYLYQVIIVLINGGLAFFIALKYITLFTYRKTSPSLISFLINELDPLGFKVKMKYHHLFQISFILIIYSAFIIFIEIGFSVFLDNLAITLLLRFFSMYMFVLLIIPIITGKLNDHLVVYLPSGYQIAIYLKINLFKHKYLDFNQIKILLKSNVLFSGKSAQKQELFRDICEKRRLKKPTGSTKNIFKFQTKYYFNEKSTIINYKNQLINIVSAIREWDHFIDK